MSDNIYVSTLKYINKVFNVVETSQNAKASKQNNPLYKEKVFR